MGMTKKPFAIKQMLCLGILLSTVVSAQQKLQALVYNQTDIECNNCQEYMAALIESTPGYDVSVMYVGPNQTTQISTELLNQSQILMVGDGPDPGSAWEHLQPHAQEVRDWVSNGGYYIGFNLGAYLAALGTKDAPQNGFGLLKLLAEDEATYPGASVVESGYIGSVVSVNWTFHTGLTAGQTVSNVTCFFENGTAFNSSEVRDWKILAQYTSTGNIAAAVAPYGNGWVGVTGVNLDATEVFYEQAGDMVSFKNPQGDQFKYGYDLIASTLQGRNGTVNGNMTTPVTSTSAPEARTTNLPTTSTSSTASTHHSTSDGDKVQAFSITILFTLAAISLLVKF